MDVSPRFAPLNAVLLGILAIGASLPFVADDASPLWSAPPTGHAAGTKFAVVFLALVLLWGAVALRSARWQSLVQAVAGVLTVLLAAFGDDLGSGGTLVVTTAVLAALAGLAGAFTSWWPAGRPA